MNEQKINYNEEFRRIAASLGGRKKLLLQACCAPCSSSVLGRLPAFDVTPFFFNPNLDTQSEFDKRAGELSRLVSLLRAEGYGYVRAPEIVPYAPDAFYRAAAGLENEPEGGKRCAACIGLRLRESARRAAETGFDYFGTTLSVSPHKNAEGINRLGRQAEQEFGVRFLPADFKKEDGYAQSVALSRRYGLYRQNYCGCVFSKNGRNET